MTAPAKSLREMAESAADYVGFGECADCDRAGDDCRAHKLQRNILAGKIEAACREFAERALRANIQHVYEVEKGDTQPNPQGVSHLVDLAIRAAGGE